MIRLLVAMLTAFAATVFIMPLVIKLMKKLKAGQTVLHYVEEHKSKSGIPTMGGVGFILPLFLGLFFAKGEKTLMIVTLVVTVGYAIVGFLDDFIKVFFKRNEGLSPLQKIVFQLAIALIVSIFAYKHNAVGGQVYSIFGFKKYNLGIFALPLYVILFVSFTNSVNLTDGLDGLASSVTVIYTLFFAAFMGFYVIYDKGQAFEETFNLILFCMMLTGGLIGFLWFNSFPAKIFMGDTGSLALGGALACLAIFSQRIFVVLILGVMYLATTLSVIIQVAYYKKTKKRVFLMAPLHHHFQKKGLHESKIVFYYKTITFFMGIVCLIGFFLANSKIF